jgi:hypothetical protein
MRSCGFTAREAMGWLRIMRPGSVIGEQQHYLCAVEHHAAATAAGTAHPEFLAPPTRSTRSMAGLTMAAELAAELATERAAQVAGGMLRRSASAVTGARDRCVSSGEGSDSEDEATEDVVDAAAVAGCAVRDA